MKLARIVTCDVVGRKERQRDDANGFMLYLVQFGTPFVHRKDDDMPRSHMKRRKLKKKHRKNIRRMKALIRKRRADAKAAAAKAKRK